MASPHRDAPSGDHPHDDYQDSQWVDVELAHLDLASSNAPKPPQPLPPSATAPRRAPRPLAAVHSSRPRFVFRKERNGWYAAKIVIRVAGFIFQISIVLLIVSLWMDWNWINIELITILVIPAVCSVSELSSSVAPPRLLRGLCWLPARGTNR